MGAEGVEGVWKLSVPSTQCCCEPEIALKNKAFFQWIKQHFRILEGGGVLSSYAKGNCHSTQQEPATQGHRYTHRLEDSVPNFLCTCDIL